MKSKYGWLVLFAFTLVGGVNQMLWLNFAPIISVIQEKYGVSELTVNVALLMSFPVLFVVFAIPAGIWIDKKGYRFVISVSTAIMSLGAILRIFDTSFAMIAAGQVLIAIAQPFIVTGISKIVGDWFEKKHHALATGLGTIGLFLGMAFSLVVTPLLVEGTDIHSAMVFFAAVTVGISLFFVLTARESGSEIEAIGSSLSEIRELLYNKNLVIIFIISFMALGFFNSFTTWLELILAQQGMNTEQAGMIGGLIIIGGIIGSATIPAISDKAGRRKPFLIICAVMAGVLLYPLATGKNVSTSMVIAGIFGALALPAFALLLTMSEEEAGSKKAGAATGFLMMAGNAGTILITILMEVVKSEPHDWTNAIYLLLGVIAIAVILSLT
jgi:MFS family permease